LTTLNDRKGRANLVFSGMNSVRLGKWIAIGVLLWPLAELAAFLLVAWAIGFLPALALAVLTSLAGAAVLRHAGRDRLAQFRVTVGAGETARFQESGASLMMVLGGFLLLLPGFITDLAGGVLLIPAVRRWLGATIARLIGASIRPADSVVDLNHQEWREVPDHQLPKPDQ
jgi:UPF0716 family protein affecting phage T7 exclusion